MVGGLIRLALDKLKKDKETKEQIVNDGVLFCSGMIAGEGLIGIVLAILAVVGVGSVLDISGMFKSVPEWVMSVGSILVFGLIIFSLLLFTVFNKKSNASATESEETNE